MQTVGRADDPSLWLLAVGESNENSDVLEVAVDEAPCAVDGIDPEASILNFEFPIDIGGCRQHVRLEFLVLEVDAALELLALLPDDLEVREVHPESLDDHGLDLEVRLDEERITSVTGSSSPFMYSLKEWSCRPCLMTWQAYRDSCVEIDSSFLKFNVIY
jgi:hypothetical protein